MYPREEERESYERPCPCSAKKKGNCNGYCSAKVESDIYTQRKGDGKMRQQIYAKSIDMCFRCKIYILLTLTIIFEQ